MAPRRTIAVSEAAVDNTTSRPSGLFNKTALATVNRFTQIWKTRTGAILIVSSLSFYFLLPLWAVIAISAPKEELCTPLAKPTILKVMYFLLPCLWLEVMWMSIIFFGLTRRYRGLGARGGAQRDVTSMAAICFMGFAVSSIELVVIGFHWAKGRCSDEV